MGERREHDAIAGTTAAFVAALKAGDASAIGGAYTDDARLLPPSAEIVYGRAAIEAFWRAGVEAGVAELELEELVVERLDEFAYEVGRYALWLRPAEGGAVVDRGKYLLVHRRQPDGSWLRAAEMFNPDELPAEHGGRLDGSSRTLQRLGSEGSGGR